VKARKDRELLVITVLRDKQVCMVKAEAFGSEAQAAKPIVALAKDFAQARSSWGTSTRKGMKCSWLWAWRHLHEVASASGRQRP